MALRATAGVDNGVELSLPTSLAVVSVGFGPMFSANTSGGFSVDYLTLRHAGMSKKRSTRRVLGLSALEYAVLAPAVALCGVLLFLGIGGSDLHPMGNYFIMAMGHVLPVPANTVWDPDVLKLPVASSYMRPLNAAQYARLQVALREAQARKQPYWNAITNNCNHFIGELAQAVGLRVPSDFQLSYMFVPSLRRMNEHSEGAASIGGLHGSSGVQ